MITPNTNQHHHQQQPQMSLPTTKSLPSQSVAIAIPKIKKRFAARHEKSKQKSFSLPASSSPSSYSSSRRKLQLLPSTMLQQAGNSSTHPSNHKKQDNNSSGRLAQMLLMDDDETTRKIVAAKTMKQPGFTTTCQRERKFVTHDYVDRSEELPSNLMESKIDENPSLIDHGKKKFPVLLHRVLDQLEAENKAHCFGWMPHGRSFMIRNRQMFIKEILPTYFGMEKGETSYCSFTRQVNKYGFRRLTKASGKDQGSYYHECFLRGKVFLSFRMKGMKINGKGFKYAASPETEPNFYKLHFCRNPCSLRSYSTSTCNVPPKQTAEQQQAAVVVRVAPPTVEHSDAAIQGVQALGIRHNHTIKNTANMVVKSRQSMTPPTMIMTNAATVSGSSTPSSPPVSVVGSTCTHSPSSATACIVPFAAGAPVSTVGVVPANANAVYATAPTYAAATVTGQRHQGIVAAQAQAQAMHVVQVVPASTAAAVVGAPTAYVLVPAGSVSPPATAIVSARPAVHQHRASAAVTTMTQSVAPAAVTAACFQQHQNHYHSTVVARQPAQLVQHVLPASSSALQPQQSPQILQRSGGALHQVVRAYRAPHRPTMMTIPRHQAYGSFVNGRHSSVVH